MKKKHSTPKTKLSGEAIRRRKKRRSRLLTLLLVLILLAGLAIVAYPTVSDWWNSMHQSLAISRYTAAVDNASEEELDAILAEADAYNRRLLDKENPFLMTEEDIAEYNALLDLSGTGVLGYIQIPSIDVSLPVYHGTAESVLQVAVGHVNWTTLPVGGESTHAALSGHSGLPSARLFTDLDRLGEGDIFIIQVLNRTMTYMVDQVHIVEPTEVGDLLISPGEDYCTLITCTPYGINTHRMLVRGHRIENAEEEERIIIVPPGAVRVPGYVAVFAAGVPLLFLFLLGMLIYSGFRTQRHSEEKLRDKVMKDIVGPEREDKAEKNGDGGEKP